MNIQNGLIPPRFILIIVILKYKQKNQIYLKCIAKKVKNKTRYLKELKKKKNLITSKKEYL